MECLVGIQANDFCLVAADTRSSRSIITMKHDQNKMFPLSTRILAAACGEAGDTTQFAEFIQQNMQLYEIRNGYELSPYGAANFTRSNLANALRSRKPYQVNMIIAGFDTQKGPELFYMDYLATLAKVPFVVHGYGSYLTLSVLDRDYRPDMTVDQAVDLLRSCAKEIQKRFIVNLDRYCVRLVTKDGISALPDLTNLSVAT
uniref:Proteasome subunit beta n=1 Tax=Clonorchis sinensis TaxID=79923 RepID=A9UKL3_CLOSI|nr:proteasome beta 2 subunit [Clonorchis sinensis]